MTATDLQTVRFVGVPVRTWSESRRWFDELLREFDVMASDPDATPARLIAFVDDVRSRFGQFSQQANLELEEAFANDVEHLNVELQLPPAAAHAASELWERVIEADEFCRQGQMLTMAMSEEHRRFIEWYLAEVARQIDGDPPRPWAEVSDA